MRHRICTTVLGAALTVVVATPALAQGNGAPSGAHYNLNIIGVENPKSSAMTGSQRHTIFVDLGKNGTVRTDILLEPSFEFEVCDGNGFDAAYSCDGTQLARNGAVFALPCNTNISQSGTIDHDNDPTTPELPIETLNCDDLSDYPTAYEVWARALGKVGGTATMTTCATEATVDANDDGGFGDEICSLENVVLTRTKGKQTFRNVTNELTSLVACFDSDDDGDSECFRYALFRDEFTDWLWKYENTGLRLAQLRFYALGED